MFIHLLVSSNILTNKALEISNLSLFENTYSESDIGSDKTNLCGCYNKMFNFSHQAYLFIDNQNSPLRSITKAINYVAFFKQIFYLSSTTITVHHCLKVMKSNNQNPIMPRDCIGSR